MTSVNVHVARSRNFALAFLTLFLLVILENDDPFSSVMQHSFER